MIYNRPLRDIYTTNENHVSNILPFLLGRNAFNFLIDNRKIEVIILPSFICPIVIDIFLRKGVKVFFYENLDENFQINSKRIIEQIKNIDSCIKVFFLWHDYLGIVGRIPKQLKEYLSIKSIETIVDATHSLPYKDYGADHTIYGFRKIINKPFGAFLMSDLCSSSSDSTTRLAQAALYELSFSFKTIVLRLSKTLIFNKFNYFYKFFSNIDSIINPDIQNVFLLEKYLYPKALKYFKNIDIEKINANRASFFHEYQRSLVGALDINTPSAPYGYPFICKDSSRLRGFLWENNIHTFVLWKNPHKILPLKLKRSFIGLSKKLIILPVNHDLDIKDIKCIVSLVNTHEASLSDK